MKRPWVLVATYRKPFPAILLGVETWGCLQPPPSQDQPRGGLGPPQQTQTSAYRKSGRGESSQPDQPEFKHDSVTLDGQSSCLGLGSPDQQHELDNS